MKLLERKARELRDVEQERLRLDRTCMQLADWCDEERETLTHLRLRRREFEAAVTTRIATVEAQVVSLQEREALLRESVAVGESELVDRLRTLHEQGGLVPVLEALDLLEVVDEERGGDAVQAA